MEAKARKEQKRKENLLTNTGDEKTKKPGESDAREEDEDENEDFFTEKDAGSK